MWTEEITVDNYSTNRTQQQQQQQQQPVIDLLFKPTTYQSRWWKSLFWQHVWQLLTVVVSLQFFFSLSLSSWRLFVSISIYIIYDINHQFLFFVIFFVIGPDVSADNTSGVVAGDVSLTTKSTEAPEMNPICGKYLHAMKPKSYYQSDQFLWWIIWDS